MQIPRWLQTVIVVGFVLWLVNQPLIAIAVDWMWFDAVGYLGIFQKSLLAKVGMWVGGLLLAILFLGVNITVAMREEAINVQRLSTLVSDLGLAPAQLQTLIRGIVGIAVALPALLFAGIAASQWLNLLSYLEREPFGQVEPIFGRDIGFYVFELPMLSFGSDLLSLLLMSALMVVGAYYVARDVFINQDVPSVSEGARRHLLVLGGLLFLLFGVDWWLGRFEMLFSSSGVVWGVSYTDVNARIPGNWIMAGCSVLVSVALLVATMQRSWRLPTVGLGLYAIARVLVAGVWPDIVQDYFVKPNELELEREFLVHNIAYTNQAYALDRVEAKPFEAEAGLTMTDIAANPLTIENVRVWDARPLLTTYGQIQEIRTYYDFRDVDVDRYMINGAPRQVMLSARELNHENIPSQARSWVNEHLQYTHGYGLTMSPVNIVTDEGLPHLFIKDLPPVSDGIDLQVDRPELYYGELTNNYVMVNTSAQEFDYPLGDQNVYADYTGTGGVDVGAPWQQALFAMYFQSFDVLLSQYIQPDSRVMFHREISDRVERLAPFLNFDADPYLVIADGKMYWMLDAYTTSNFYPYAERLRLGRQSVNYIRNSVKIVVDAYNGSVDFYIADESDPLIRVYAKVFPNSFKPLSEMPDSLQEHIRYPADFFNIQATMYRSYHMKDPTVFYNKEDMWAVPFEKYSGKEQPMESYYLIMKLPEEEEEEFILLLPFVPVGKDNMISWLAARCDKENYGNLILYQFPKQKLIYGPRQIEARIDQDPDISEMITLWSQAGSGVVRGNLLVIPIGNSLMYVEPLYLQAESSQLPELKRVIVSYENRIAMRNTLDEALRAVFAPGEPVLDENSDAVSSPAESFDFSGLAPGWAGLVDRAQQLFSQATQRQQAGDWAGYGEAIAELEATLAELGTQATAAGAADVEDVTPAAPAAPAE